MFVRSKSAFFSRNLISLILAFAIFFLSFVSNSFAIDHIEALENAIETNNLQEARRVLNEKDVDFDELVDLRALPSVEMAELLFKNERNSINPDKFMELVIEFNPGIYNFNRVTGFFSAVYHLFTGGLTKSEDKELKFQLIELALDNGAKANGLLRFAFSYEREKDINQLLNIALTRFGSFKDVSFSDKEIFAVYYLPSLKVAKFMLENSLDSDEFLAMIMANYCVDDDEIKSQEELIKLALAKGAGLDKVVFIINIPSYQLFELLLNNTSSSKYWKIIGLVLKSYYKEELSEEGKNNLNKIIELLLQKEKGATPELPVKNEFDSKVTALYYAYSGLYFEGAWQLLRSIGDDKFIKAINIIFGFDEYLVRGRLPLSFINRVALTYLDADNEIHDLLVSRKELPEYSSKGVPLLCYAAIRKDNKLLLRLIENGFAVNVQDNQGNTPLMLAMLSDNKEGVDILIKHKANINVTNSFNSTALHMAYYTYRNQDHILSLISDHNADPSITDKFGTSFNSHILELILPCMLDPKEECGSDFDLSPDVLSRLGKNTVYELLVKKFQGESIQNIRVGSNDKIAYIGIVTDKGYYSGIIFSVATKIMAKYHDIHLRIITPDMIDDDFIQQFDGLIVPGASDNFPKDKKEFIVKDLKQETMLSIEKLYQNVLGLAQKYDIPTIGVCSGNQHTILYDKGSIKPVTGYVGKKKHYATFVRGSISHFLALTPREQRQALKSCLLPNTTISIDTAHHYAGVQEKLGAVELGAISEEGVVQSVYKGTKSFGFQFHPENYYGDESDTSNPNRNTMIWDNFLNICRQRHRYYLHAKKNNIDHKDAMHKRGEQNKKIIARLEECAAQTISSQQENAELSTENRNQDDKRCIQLQKAFKKSGLDSKEFIDILTEVSDDDDQAKVQECSSYYTNSGDCQNERVEDFKLEEDICDKDRFQWSDYEVLN